MDMVLVLAIGLGGGLGAAARFVADGVMRSRWSHSFPLATVVINVAGSFLIGIIEGAALYHSLGPWWTAAFATGLCGGFTTFSTAMVETVRLIQSGRWGWAVVNALGTLVVCVTAAAAGLGLMWVV